VCLCACVLVCLCACVLVFLCSCVLLHWCVCVLGTLIELGTFCQGLGSFLWTTLGRSLLSTYALPVATVQAIFAGLFLLLLAVACPILRLPPPKDVSTGVTLYRCFFSELCRLAFCMTSQSSAPSPGHSRHASCAPPPLPGNHRPPHLHPSTCSCCSACRALSTLQHPSE
jgi:hypothetical protein